jgi:hypothetical protein
MNTLSKHWQPLYREVMRQTGLTRHRQAIRVIAAWAIIGSLACLHSSAAEAEKESSKQPAPSDSSLRKPSLDSVKSPKLRQELVARMAEDQEARKQWLRLMGRPQQSKDAKKQIDLAMAKLREVDRKNLVRMKVIVDRSGWPGKSMVGSDGAQAAWLLVQHADLDLRFQKRCLALIVVAVKKGEARPEQMAYLVDRVRVGEKKKQVYGTQFHDVGGKQVPYPVENEAGLDRRRKEIGMPPMAEYRKSIDQMYPSGQPKKGT